MKNKKEIVDYLISHRDNIDTSKTVEEDLGIRICTSEVDHLYVMSKAPTKNYTPFKMKPLGIKEVVCFGIESTQIEQTCILCGKKQLVLKRNLQVRK